VKRNTTIRVSEKTIDYYTKQFKNNHAGAKIAIEGYPHLRDEALKNLTDFFSPDELKVLISSSPSKIKARDMASRRKWEAEIADYCDKKESMGILTDIIQKVREMDALERFVMRELIDGIWNNPAIPSKPLDFIEFINK
jgi:hypothetical protein